LLPVLERHKVLAHLVRDGLRADQECDIEVAARRIFAARDTPIEPRGADSRAALGQRLANLREQPLPALLLLLEERGERTGERVRLAQSVELGAPGAVDLHQLLSSQRVQD